MNGVYPLPVKGRCVPEQTSLCRTILLVRLVFSTQGRGRGSLNSTTCMFFPRGTRFRLCLISMRGRSLSSLYNADNKE